MEKLNKSGRILLQYREEYKKHYADNIDNSLKQAVLEMYNEKIINEKIFRNIFNGDISDDTFEGILLRDKSFIKNKSELNSEFDKIRQKVNDYMIEIGFIDGMSTKNAIDFNKIIIIHEFDLNRAFMTAFFGVNQMEIVPLMRRRGFMEKFSVLRLNQVLKEIYNEMNPLEDVDYSYSLVYYNRETKGFSIDYKYSVSIEVLSSDEKMKSIIDLIKNEDTIVTDRFKKKIGEKYLINQKGLNHRQHSITIYKEKPTKIKDPESIISNVTKSDKKSEKPDMYIPKDIPLKNDSKTSQKNSKDKTDPKDKNNKIQHDDKPHNSKNSHMKEEDVNSELESSDLNLPLQYEDTLL